MQLEIKELDQAQDFNPESKEIVRSNAFINGKYKFSLMQTKILLLLSSQIKKGDQPGKLYTLPLSSMLASFNTRNNKAVVDNAKALQHKTVEVPSLNKHGKEYISSITLLTKVMYPKDYSGNLYIEIHSDLKPHFLDLKEKYSKYLLDYVWDFKYEHSIRIYEMLKEYWNIGKKNRYFAQSEFKHKLGIADSYKRKNAKGEIVDNFKDLRVNVLEKAVQDFERCADITFEVEPKKKGRVVAGFILHIKSRFSDEEEKLINKTNNRGVEKALVAQLEKDYDPELIMFLINKAESDKEIRNPSGWVRKALNEGFMNKEFEAYKKKQEQAVRKKQQAKKQLEVHKRLDEISEEYNEFWRERCLYYFTQNENKLEEFIGAYAKANKHDPKVKNIIEEFEDDTPSDVAKRKLGNFILQQSGTPEERDLKAFARIRYKLEID
jgi:plasmid replication initiation protein